MKAEARSPRNSWTMLAWRGVFGALGIAIVLFVHRRREALSNVLTLGLPGWLYTTGSAAGMIFFITSLRHTTVAHVAIIYATVPFAVAILANAQPQSRTEPALKN